jgi:hypothetical protein
MNHILLITRIAFPLFPSSLCTRITSQITLVVITQREFLGSLVAGCRWDGSAGGVCNGLVGSCPPKTPGLFRQSSSILAPQRQISKPAVVVFLAVQHLPTSLWYGCSRRCDRFITLPPKYVMTLIGMSLFFIPTISVDVSLTHLVAQLLPSKYAQLLRAHAYTAPCHSWLSR